MPPLLGRVRCRTVLESHEHSWPTAAPLLRGCLPPGLDVGAAARLHGGWLSGLLRVAGVGKTLGRAEMMATTGEEA